MIKHHKFYKTSAVLAAMLFLSQTALAANPNPAYQEEPPGFAAAPTQNAQAAVLENHITFKVNSVKSNWVNVKSNYHIKNLSDEEIVLPVAMPFISQAADGFMEDLKLSLNGETVPFTARRIEDLDPKWESITEYLKQNTQAADVWALANRLQQKEKEIGSPPGNELINVYSVLLSNGENTEFEISCNVSGAQLLFNNFRALSFEDGKWQTLSAYDETNHIDRVQIAVLGSSLSNAISFNGISDEKILHTRKTFRDFILTDVMLSHNEEISSGSNDEIVSYFQKRIQKSISEQAGYINLTEITADYMQRDYLGLALSKIKLEPQTEYDFTVSYNLKASVNHNKNEIDSNTFRYSFRPLQGWISCQNVSIEIIPNELSPYLIDSSVSFQKTSSGSYEAVFDTLPTQLFSFTTCEVNLHSPSHLLWLWIVIPSVLLAGSAGVLWLIRRKKKKEENNN